MTTCAVSAVFVVAFVLACPGLVLGQAKATRPSCQVSPPVVTTDLPASQKPLSNADVIKMVSAGLSDDLVLSIIRQADRTAFEIGPDSVIRLKAAPGIYRVTPTEELGPGECCLYYVGGATVTTGHAGKLFDFGVD